MSGVARAPSIATRRRRVPRLTHPGPRRVPRFTHPGPRFTHPVRCRVPRWGSVAQPEPGCSGLSTAPLEPQAGGPT
jgi:hypothetical protein